MHETRNFLLVILLAVSAAWAFFAWFFLDAGVQSTAWWQRGIATGIVLLSAGWLWYALQYEDRLPDKLREVVGELFYECDGLSFMPIVRVNGSQAEICVYYQNRFENLVQAIVHLRPPEDSFVIKPDVRDVHFAFRVDGGDFGVIHQPIAVPEHLQGEVIDVKLAAATYYPRSHGSRLRKHVGMPCGTLLVDWAGSAFKSGVHEVSGEIELHNPARLHLSMPRNVRSEFASTEWKQERLAAGVG